MKGSIVGRIDYQLNSNHSLFGRYMATRDKKPSAFAKTDNVLTTVNPHIDNLAQSFTAGDTKVFGHQQRQQPSVCLQPHGRQSRQRPVLRSARSRHQREQLRAAPDDRGRHRRASTLRPPPRRAGSRSTTPSR